MTIRKLAEDASFLIQHGRYTTALAVLLIAISASSRRTFPKHVQSRKNPKEKMKDWEAFTLFLGSRIRKITGGDFGDPDEGGSGITVGFRGEQHDLAFILYKFYRCELVHEGELPVDVEFTDHKLSAADPRMGNGGWSISVGPGNKIELDYGWLSILQEVVKNARCNATEFGINHFDLRPIAGIDETSFLSSLALKYNTSPGRIQIMKQAAYLISPILITEGDNCSITTAFRRLVVSRKITGGAIGGLMRHGFTDFHGALQTQGIELLRDIASGYQRIEVL